MIDIRPILSITGILLTVMSSCMLIPAVVDLAFGNANWVNFVFSAILTAFIGLSAWLISYQPRFHLNVRQAFIMTVMVWVALAVAGAIPIYLSAMTNSFTDAFFESMSGTTTTGATVFTNLDNAPPGLLLWRAMLQWMGGLGIIVMAVAILPMLHVGGMQLFKAEAFETADKILPRATQISGSMTTVFVIMTISCGFAYYFAGMGGLDAAIHAMTTVATGGFSSKDASLGYFDSGLIETISIIFMCAGSLPFLLYIQLTEGRIRDFFKEQQVKLFFILLACFTVIIWAYLQWQGHFTGLKALRYAAFNVVSIMTGTGYASVDYGQWGAFAVGLFFIMMFIGGCAGSTSCGIKIFRFQVIAIEIRRQIREMLWPNGIFIARFNGAPMPYSVSHAVTNFLFLFLVSVFLLAVALSFTGLDALTAFSGAATAIANVGPGLGQIIGPSGNFASLNDSAKWLFMFGMLLGRLELLTVLVLLNPYFWLR